jgi:hypothetical protein
VGNLNMGAEEAWLTFFHYDLLLFLLSLVRKIYLYKNITLNKTRGSGEPVSLI